MIGAFRRSLLLLATAVLALLGTVSLTAFPLLHRGDDIACDLQAVVHDGSAHQFERGDRTPVSDDHCLLCHWSQWLRAIQNDAAGSPSPVDSGGAAAASDPLPRTATTSRSPARAPPLA